MTTHIKKPSKLKDIVASHFHAARADRTAATTTLFSYLKTQRSPDIRAYLLARAARLLVHEYARSQRISTPSARNLMDYPICTSKYLAEALLQDLTEEIEEHKNHAITNANKSAFFAELAGGLDAANSQAKTQHQVRQIFSEKDLEAAYERHVGPIR